MIALKYFFFIIITLIHNTISIYNDSQNLNIDLTSNVKQNEYWNNQNNTKFIYINSSFSKMESDTDISTLIAINSKKVIHVPVPQKAINYTRLAILFR
jgi:hypothetical protein